MDAVDARRLFVFAGAGVSRSAPAGLPMFGPLRDELLRQVGLDRYLPPSDGRTDDPAAAGRHAVAQGLAPEPFMLALREAGTDVQGWLHEVLGGGRPNAGHLTLARLALAGAHVWTVNFDRLVERSLSDLSVVAWPDDPSSPNGLALLKPHGTLGGPLAFTAADVLAPLTGSWRERLVADIGASDTVVFVGYSGRDLDLQPLWDGLVRNRRVLWFDTPDAAEQDRKRAVLRTCDQAGRLLFPPAVGETWPNPTAAFVDWCANVGLGTVPSALRASLHDEPPAITFPVLRGDLEAARGEVLAVLGDPRSARRTFVSRSLRGPDRTGSARRAVNLALNHGGPATAAVLGLGRAFPPVGHLREVREGLALKRVSVLFNAGRHDQVLRLTRRLPSSPVSTLLLLRAGSKRMTGSLDDAAYDAERALGLARQEKHPVRTANAALQWCYALLWAGRLDEARRAHDTALLPYAGLAATRWVAWAGVVHASLLVHERRPDGALAALDLAASRFEAEALLDGLVSTLTVRLTALRQAGDDDGYRKSRQALAQVLDGRSAGTYHAPGHSFSREAVMLEDGQFLVHHEHAAVRGRALLADVTRSRYPVHAALAHLFLSSAGAVRAADHAEEALLLADRIEARGIAEQARAVLSEPTPVHAELFFP
jgi:hypothetical protein